ncbi:MAG: dynamin family protein [Defluviitaleaceae bacterium]|nr:dynamin family protein [Defluviitaleaceae bacterium]
MQKQDLKIAIVGETGSGKSTFISMCSDEDKLYADITGKAGMPGTTRETSKITLYKSESVISQEQDNDEKPTYNYCDQLKNYRDGLDSYFPLSANIELNNLKNLVLFDTRGLNDVDEKTNKEDVENSVLDVCQKADIIIVTIAQGGNPPNSKLFLEKVFEEFIHIPIIVVGRSGEATAEDIASAGECSLDSIKELAKDLLQKHIDSYNKDGQTVDAFKDILVNTAFPFPNSGNFLSPLCTVLQNCKELTSRNPTSPNSTKESLKKSINDILQYSLNLTSKLYEVINKNTDLARLKEHKEKIFERENLVKLYTPMIKAFPAEPFIPYKSERWENEILEYCWYGPTKERRPARYTYYATHIYESILKIVASSKMFGYARANSELVLKIRNSRKTTLTPGTLNFIYRYISTVDIIPLNLLLDYRKDLIETHSDLFEPYTGTDYWGGEAWGKPFDDKILDWEKAPVSFKYDVSINVILTFIDTIEF